MAIYQSISNAFKSLFKGKNSTVSSASNRVYEAVKDNFKNHDILSVEDKTKGTAEGVIVELRDRRTKEEFTIMVKSAPKFYDSKTDTFIKDKDTIQYEVPITDLMKNLDNKTVVNNYMESPQTGEKFIVSEWKNGLRPSKDPIYNDFEYLNAYDFNDFEYLLNEYRATKHAVDIRHPDDSKDLQIKQKVLKAVICSFAAGNTDIHIGNNIMFDKNYNPVIIDNGCSYFTSSSTEEDCRVKFTLWNHILDKMEKSPDKEIRSWGKEISSYKDFALQHIRHSNQDFKRINNEVETELYEAKMHFKNLPNTPAERKLSSFDDKPPVSNQHHTKKPSKSDVPSFSQRGV